MADSVDQTTGAKGGWELSGEALEALLQALDANRDVAAGRYELLRRKLIDLFAWRCAEMPEALADQTLDRLARRLAQGDPVERVESFALGIARMQLKEVARIRERRQQAMREIRAERSDATGEAEMLEAIERCAEKLPESSRELIARYYRGNREALARDLGLSLNAVRTRVLRIRRKLYECVIRSRNER